jgi:Cft2 family RNA processing exonuclease
MNKLFCDHMQLNIDGKIISIDDRRVGDINLVSHAHMDHAYAFYSDAREIFSSKKTEEIAKSYKKFDKNVSEPKIQSFNSGHILGGRQFLIENGERILYAGEILLEENPVAEKIQIPKDVDIVYVDSTYYKYKVSFPSREEIYSTLESFIANSLQYNQIVFVVYEIGKAQEVIKFLNTISIVPQVSERIARIAEAYSNFGIKLKYTLEESEVKVFGRKEAIKEKLKDKKSLLVALSGWALIFKLDCDYQFPLSDHADYNQINQFLDILKPKKVFFI